MPVRSNRITPDLYDVVWSEYNQRYSVAHANLRGNSLVNVAVSDVPSYSEATKIAEHRHDRIELPVEWHKENSHTVYTQAKPRPRA